MSNISKLEFPALNISGDNYMSWTANVKRHLRAMGALDAISDGFSDCTEEQKAKADVFIHKHIDELLQQEYFNCINPYVIWKDLKDRFDHQKEVLLPTARDEWNNLRFQDFKSVNDYTSALFKICSMLEFCGQYISEEDKLEKTFSTFHASNINLQTQYRLLKFKRYSDLNAFLLIAEKNNAILMKNHQSRPTGSLAIPEANVAQNNDHKNYGRKREQSHRRGHGRNHFNGRNHSFKGSNTYRGNSHGRGRGRGRGRGQYYRTSYHHAPQNNNSKRNEASGSEKNGNSTCFRCGSKSHWSKTCRTPPHLCELYQASIKGKEKEVYHVDNMDVNVELNTADFSNDMEL